MNNAFFNNPIVHGIITIILFVIPVVISTGGSWQSLTLGGVLAGLYKVLQNKSQGLAGMGGVK